MSSQNHRMQLSEVEDQIYQKRKSVRYDIRDLTVEVIVAKYDSSLDEVNSEKVTDPGKYNYIFIPEYQRDFTWDRKRQSKLIESIILGLPIPFIFVAENKDSSWEIVDGSQRVRTLHSFVRNELELNNLESLDALNGYKFNELDVSRRGKILSTALRLIVLSEETADDVKKDMFERINRGSDLLKPMEKRKGIYIGPFNEFLYDYCKTEEKFSNLTLIDKWLEKRQEREELLLRFFAISENDMHQKGISGSGIAGYLDAYLDKKNRELEDLDETGREIEMSKHARKINAVVDFVDKCFPYGFRHTRNPQTKRSVFEAISVGVWRYLESVNHKPDFEKFKPETIEKYLKDGEFKKFTHVANELHQKTRLKGRVDFIFDMLIELGAK
ncbi:DUF262 domain-containing protein [Massilia niastensis]|uniref:DUF262 domain-containing protein n=1 Tax=Massilia niastensis TaxID=544911 RepID=UPI0003A54C93|nr:DUF262 domain-containing protein [Massilia niastensis]